MIMHKVHQTGYITKEEIVGTTEKTVTKVNGDKEYKKTSYHEYFTDKGYAIDCCHQIIVNAINEENERHAHKLAFLEQEIKNLI
jgi:hypothetical protein